MNASSVELNGETCAEVSDKFRKVLATLHWGLLACEWSVSRTRLDAGYQFIIFVIFSADATISS